MTFSAYLKAGGLRYCELILDNGCEQRRRRDLRSVGRRGDRVRHSSARHPAWSRRSRPRGGGYFRCAVSGILDTVSTTARASIVSNDNATTWTWYPSYAGSTSNTLYAAFPQVELAASPGAPTSYKPTLTTL